MKLDRDASISELRERDRAISIELGAVTELDQVLGWSRARGDESLGGMLFDYVRTGSWCMLVGAAIGLPTAIVAFFYDGASRINVLVIGLFFVVLPLATLVCFVAAARVSTPMVNVGRLGHVIASVVHGEHDSVTQMFAGRQGQGISKWLTLLWSQCFALGFSITATVTALILIVFTDLAFGWSTTPDFTTATIECWLRFVAAPWSGVMPAAVPDSDLVEISRYFRLDSASHDAVDPSLLGRWWRSHACATLLQHEHAVDYSGYPDCRPAFIAAFESLANLATKMGVEGERIEIHTPLIDLTKAEIIRRGSERIGEITHRTGWLAKYRGVRFKPV